MYIDASRVQYLHGQQILTVVVRIYLCSIRPKIELVYLILYLGQAIPQTQMSAQGLAAFSAKLFFITI